jgi:hypothetical protein
MAGNTSASSVESLQIYSDGFGAEKSVAWYGRVGMHTRHANISLLSRFQRLAFFLTAFLGLAASP